MTASLCFNEKNTQQNTVFYLPKTANKNLMYLSTTLMIL